jgi:hypothetical protein
VLDKIRASYDKLSREELLDLICYISKTYIVEQTLPFDVPIPEKDEAPPDEEVADAPAAAQPPASARFATLVEGLKKRTQLPQLDGFSVEDGKAVLVVDNQKVTFGDRVTVEFVPLRGRPSTNTPAAAPRPTTPLPTPAPALPAPPPPPGARKDLPGGDGRTHQGGPKPPLPAPPAPPKKEKPKDPAKDGDLADVDHIVERFKRLDLD